MRNSPPETSATAPFFEQSWSIKLETLTVTNVSSLGFSLKNLNIFMSDAFLPFTNERTLEKSSLLGSPFQSIHPKRRLPEQTNLSQRDIARLHHRLTDTR